MNTKISRSRSSSIGSSSGTLINRSSSASKSGKYKLSESAPVPKATERLLNESAFKNISKSNKQLSRRAGSKVSEIDKKLKAYEQLKGSPADIVKRADLLKELKKLCEDYIQAKTPTNGDRLPGVEALLSQIETELSFMDLFAETHKATPGNTKGALKKYFEGKDAIAEAKAAKHPISPKGGQTPASDELFTAIVRKLGDEGTRSLIMQEIIHDDVALLKQMSTQSGVDDLLGKIIREVMRNENQIHFQESQGMASGAVLAGQKDIINGIKKKYRLDMQMDQAETIIRLSSLLHEMTHIAIHEHFDNTDIHLAFAKGMSDEDILALSARRTDQLNELRDTLKAEKDLFSDSQYEALLEKITYPIEGKNTLESYAKAFKTKGLTGNEYDKIMELHEAGANNTLTEFDTVINQMFFMINGWKIDQDSDFYITLKEIAREAYKHRKG